MSAPPKLDDAGWAQLVTIANDENASGVLRETAREMVWRRSADDLAFFLRSFWYVQVIGKGYEIFVPRPYQVGEIEVFQRACEGERLREVRLKARQIGLTTISTAGAFWSAYFHEHTPWLFASQGQTEAQDTLTTRVKRPYDLLPLWMRDKGPQRIDQSMERMSFDNQSEIMSIASTSKSGRSKSVFGVLLDEYAFVEDADGLMSAIDPLCYGPMIVFSTANGIGNPYHATWIESQRQDSEWNVTSRDVRPNEPWFGAFQPWSAVPNRDKKWYDREKRKYRGREHEFFQEYPETPEEAFIKSGRTALPIDLLREEQCWCDPEWRIDVDLIVQDVFEVPAEAVLGVGEEADNELWIWELPTVERQEGSGHVLRKPSYVISTDIAEGVVDGDYTAITVYNSYTMEAVATYRGHYPIEYLAELLAWLGYFYFTALQVPERNNMGILPIANLQRGGYPRLFRMDNAANRQPGKRSERYGWLTTPQSKPRMIYDFVRKLKDGHILLHDKRFFDEALTFIQDGKGGFNASSGNHDDSIMSHMIGAQGCASVPDYPLLWQDPEQLQVTYAQLRTIDRKNASDDHSGRGQGARHTSKSPSRSSWIAV